jgi:hypothetical protein
MTLQHIVLFKFPTELDPSDERDLFARVWQWPEQIGGIDAIRLGASINTERTRGYQYLLYMEVSDEEALRAYQRHPVHQEFAAWVAEKGGTPLAFDYHLDASTVAHPQGEAMLS